MSDYNSITNYWRKLHKELYSAVELLDEQSQASPYNSPVAKYMHSNAAQIWDNLSSNINLPDNHVDIGSNLYPFVRNLDEEVIKRAHVYLSDPIYTHKPTISKVTSILEACNCLIDSKGFPLNQIPDKLHPYNLYLISVLNYLSIDDFKALLRNAKSVWIAEGEQGFGQVHKNKYKNIQEVVGLAVTHDFVPLITIKSQEEPLGFVMVKQKDVPPTHSLETISI